MGRFEQMDADVAVVQARLGMPVARLPKINVTNRPRSAEEAYTAEMRAIVAQVYQTDFKLFAYDDQQAQ